MTSTSSPTGLYSGGLRWVDPPGAAAVSVKPSDGAGPGPPENSWGGAAAVTGGARSAPAAAGGRRAGDGVGRRGPWATPPGRGRAGAPGLSPGEASAGLEARASALREHRGDRDSRGRLGRGEAAGAGRGGRGQARRPGRGGLPWVLCRSGLHRRLSWCRVRTVVRFISLEQRRGAATWCTTRLAGAECTMIVRLAGRQCRYRKLPSGVSRPGAGPAGPGGSALSNRPRSAWVFEACSE